MNFDDKAKDWDKDPKKVERAKIFAGEIIQILGARNELNGLEFGSGTGLVSFQLTNKFRSITLADSSTGMLDVLQQKIEREKISIMKPFLVTESNNLRSLSGFDVIYTLLTLHHIKDIGNLFSEFRDILNTGGYLFIGDLVNEDGSFHSSDPEFDGHPGFDTGLLKAQLHEAGFEYIEDKIFLSIERENNGIVKNYPLFILACKKN